MFWLIKDETLSSLSTNMSGTSLTIPFTKPKL